MAKVRSAVAVAALVVVSGHEYTMESVGKEIWGKILSFTGLSGTRFSEDLGDSHGHHHGHRRHWHQKMHHKMEEAHRCHMKCGTDGDCHSKCPKPWAPFVKACEDFPSIKACHDKCKDADCDKCPKFEKEWMNRKYAKAPELVAKKAEKKCPKILEAHKCHQACAPGDHECHHKCPHPFGKWHHHGHHGHDHDEDHHHWHHHDHDHDDEHHHWHHHDHDGEHHHWHHKKWHERMHHKMEEAHACHKKCGTDVDCHDKCPKPWAPFLKACQEWPAIKACHEKCKDADCEKCPKFDLAWLNKKLAEKPEIVAKKAEKMCPIIEKTHACHQACKPGDFECHKKCRPEWPHHHHHHEEDEGHSHHHRHHEDEKPTYGDGDGDSYGDGDDASYGDGDGDGSSYGDGDGEGDILV